MDIQRQCRQNSLPHGAEGEQDVPRVLPTDRGGAADRSDPLLRGQGARQHADARHLLPVHAAAHHPGRRLLHAQPALLRPPGHDPAVRRGRHHLQHADHRPLPVGGGPDRPVRLRDAPLGHVPLLGAHLGRRPCGRARRLRGDPRQRDPLHRSIWRVFAQRRCDSGVVPYV